MSLFLGGIPDAWKVFYRSISSLSLEQWIHDFQKRLLHQKDLEKVTLLEDLSQRSIWLGGLFSPEGFLTATRQVFSKQLGISMENLSLDCKIMADVKSDNSSVVMSTTNVVTISSKLMDTTHNSISF